VVGSKQGKLSGACTGPVPMASKLLARVDDWRLFL
jgi:hypothetical protein